jgi:hypothetical protein
MKNVLKNIKSFFENTLSFWIVLAAIIICSVFLCIGVKSENGSITIDGKNATISDNITKTMESFENAIYRVMNEDAPTDEETIRKWSVLDESEGLGAAQTIDVVIGRRLPDGDTDGGKGWQCSKYTAYLATGRREYSKTHPDYGPANGKDIAAWLVKNFGWKYIDKPVKGAIGSGGFNTKYGHTAMYLYSTGANTAMVNDANAVPLTVSTWNMNINGWVWVVPGDYKPNQQPTPTPAPKPNHTPKPTPAPAKTSYTVRKGDTLGGIAIKMGWFNGGKLYGDDGYAQSLATENNIAWRGLIYPGQVIRKP